MTAPTWNSRGSVSELAMLNLCRTSKSGRPHSAARLKLSAGKENGSPVSLLVCEYVQMREVLNTLVTLLFKVKVRALLSIDALDSIWSTFRMFGSARSTVPGCGALRLSER